MIPLIALCSILASLLVICLIGIWGLVQELKYSQDHLRKAVGQETLALIQLKKTKQEVAALKAERSQLLTCEDCDALIVRDAR